MIEYTTVYEALTWGTVGYGGEWESGGVRGAGRDLKDNFLEVAQEGLKTGACLSSAYSMR